MRRVKSVFHAPETDHSGISLYLQARFLKKATAHLGCLEILIMLTLYAKTRSNMYTVKYKNVEDKGRGT